MRKPYYTPANLERNNSVGFLVKRAGLLMMQVAERRFEKTSVTFTQWVALIGLSMQEEPVSATQLSKELCHDMGALTRVVDDLEQRGLVRRERSSADRRAVEIRITPEGCRVAEDAKHVLVELLNELVGPFSHREVETLISLLRRLCENLERAAAKEPPAKSPKSPTRAPARKPARTPAAERSSRRTPSGRSGTSPGGST
jgi:DNA-binding MarR family transcriptional regulator